MKKNGKGILFAESLLQDVLSESPAAADEILSFYEPYIYRMAMRRRFDRYGRPIGFEVDEDLAQEIRLALVKSLPKLRQALNRSCEWSEESKRSVK